MPRITCCLYDALNTRGLFPCDGCCCWALSDPIECSLLWSVPPMVSGNSCGDGSAYKTVGGIEANVVRDGCSWFIHLPGICQEAVRSAENFPTPKFPRQDILGLAHLMECPVCLLASELTSHHTTTPYKQFSVSSGLVKQSPILFARLMSSIMSSTRSKLNPLLLSIATKSYEPCTVPALLLSNMWGIHRSLSTSGV